MIVKTNRTTMVFPEEPTSLSGPSSSSSNLSRPLLAAPADAHVPPYRGARRPRSLSDGHQEPQAHTLHNMDGLDGHDADGLAEFDQLDDADRATVHDLINPRGAFGTYSPFRVWGGRRTTTLDR
ncbi:unnamed protein product [Vitrella brassicaformis CCMP3155]|uniref:Uncharacterized protein n=1 Tax=Vitrella brassicaformis (strain CCMP3155) TaxID=1169540 RepID=A0A0G4EK57_VITBC|nr:unnamed protein product [Vitrella brassicaformis CCMP3155]|eukprot:CEL96906.1 unnamed protein product [Vitrella brassicaformis CCMP3155]